MKKTILIIIGCISVGLGIIGILLPVIPTTPFLLLAGGCFIRSSEKCHNWLINNNIFGKIIKDYIEQKCLPFRIKITGIIVLTLTLGTTIIFITKNIYFKLILTAIGVLVAVHILRIKTKKI